MIKPLAKLIVALNGNLKKDQIAAGFAWGLLLGLIPAGNFFWIALFVVSFILRHHHASKLLVFAIIKIFIDPINQTLDKIGWSVLNIQSLKPFFTTLYNTPFVPFTGFNNTLVAGGLVSGLILFVPIFFLIFFLIPPYRDKVVPKIRNSKVLRVIKKLPLLAPILNAVTSTED
ncbi:MAG: TIGR03546 family protein [Treponema sp.]|jgi:uncharacterized protein (TIGR03546 family)|nr:TIGR03546 family protein [Treponema sp.]